MFVRTEKFSDFVKLYPVITTIVAIHIIIYVLQWVPFLPHNWVLQHLTGVNILIAEGEYWRLVTPIFVHLGFAHLLFNSFSLVLFGPYLEALLGRISFFILYLTTWIIANMATYLFKPLIYSHVGASGSIFGLFGIYVALIYLYKDIFPQQGRQVVIPIVVLGLVMTFLQPGINITAHVVGLLSGFIIGYIFFKIKPIYR